MTGNPNKQPLCFSSIKWLDSSQKGLNIHCVQYSINNTGVFTVFDTIQWWVVGYMYTLWGRWNKCKQERRIKARIFLDMLVIGIMYKGKGTKKMYKMGVPLLILIVFHLCIICVRVCHHHLVEVPVHTHTKR